MTDPTELNAAPATENDVARAEALAYVERREAAAAEDFSQFWAVQTRKATTLRNVFGVDVTLPPALPLGFEVAARKLQASKDPEDTKHMVGLLFGADAMTRWSDAGMDVDQFAVLLLWGTQNTRTPDSMTLGEAYAAYQKQISEGGDTGGKAAA